MYRDISIRDVEKLENTKKAIAIASAKSFDVKRLVVSLKAAYAGTLTESMFNTKNAVAIAERLVEKGYLIKKENRYVLTAKAKQFKSQLKNYERLIAQGIMLDSETEKQF